MEFIKRLQNKPQKVKQRIVWITVSVVMVCVIALWLLTITFENNSPLNLSKLIESQIVSSGGK